MAINILMRPCQTLVNDDNERIRYVGKITVQDEHNNIFYQETSDLEPIIDGNEFPRLSKWPVKEPNKYNNNPKEQHWLVVIHGSISREYRT